LIATLLFSFLVSALLGFFSISLIWPSRFCTRATLIMRSSLALGFGFGFSSCLFFCWLCLAAARGAKFWTFVLSEVGITAGLGLLWIATRGGFSSLKTDDYERDADSKASAARWVRPIFWLVLSFAIIAFILMSLRYPHGGFDATSIWNLRARFLARGTDHWRDAFVGSPSLPHPDYPLLLPATIARCWKYLGAEPVLVPMIVAFVFTFATVGLLCSSLSFLRSKHVGYLAGMVLFSASSFTVLGSWQYADTVIGFFMMSSIVALSLYDAAPIGDNMGFLLLAGVAAGFCSWTKNEGMLFLLLFLVGRFLSQLKINNPKVCAREAAIMMMGLAPVLAVVLYFKLRVASANYYLKSGLEYSVGPMHNILQSFVDTQTIGHKLRDVSRYWLIVKSMAAEMSRLGGKIIGITPLLALYLICGGVKKNSIPAVRTGAMILGLMLCGYFFVYLTTPMNLAYHLQSSLLRVLLQLWPSAVFVFFLATSTSPAFQPSTDVDRLVSMRAVAASVSSIEGP